MRGALQLGVGRGDSPGTGPLAVGGLTRATISPVFISITHVHRTKPLWRKSPLTNLWWAVTVPVV